MKENAAATAEDISFLSIVLTEWKPSPILQSPIFVLCTIDKNSNFYEMMLLASGVVNLNWGSLVLPEVNEYTVLIYVGKGKSASCIHSANYASLPLACTPQTVQVCLLHALSGWVACIISNDWSLFITSRCIAAATRLDRGQPNPCTFRQMRAPHTRHTAGRLGIIPHLSHNFSR